MNSTSSPDRSIWLDASLNRRLEHMTTMFVEHESILQILRFIDRGLLITEAQKRGLGLMVISPSGGGKSTFIKQLHKRFPREVKETITLRPMVHIKIPKNPQASSLGEALLKALGDPLPSAGNADAKFERIKALLIATGTKVLAIDDFQDVPARRGAKGIDSVSDWIRDLIEIEFPGIVIAFGTEKAMVVIQQDDTGQLRRRMQARIDVPLFSVESKSEAARFRRLIQNIDAMLPLAEESGLADIKVIPYLFAATGGNFDYLNKLLKYALIRAREKDRERIEFEDLRQGFDDQHQIVATYGNPFAENYDGHPLTRPGQVFFNAINDEDDNSRSKSRTKKRTA